MARAPTKQTRPLRASKRHPSGNRAIPRNARKRLPAPAARQCLLGAIRAPAQAEKQCLPSCEDAGNPIHHGLFGRKPNGYLLLLAVFAFLLLANLAQSASPTAFSDYVDKQQAYFQTKVVDWWGLATLAILICISFNTLLYMLGVTLSSQEIKNYAKSEFLQVSASSLMIFFAVALIFTVTSGTVSPPQKSAAFDFMGDLLGDGASSIRCTAAPGNKFILWEGTSALGTGPIAAFKCKLQEKITALDNAYVNVEQKNQGVEQKTSTQIFMFGFPIWNGDWDLERHQEVEQAHLISSKIIDLEVSLHAQFALAEYVQKNMLSIFLPLGLVLRILPLTRGVGGLFISLGVGFFFVWPTFFLLTDPSFVVVNLPPAQAKQSGGCFVSFTGSTSVIAGLIADNGEAQALDAAISEARELVYSMTIATTFYPFVSLVITLIFIRAMTPLLGGDMGELMRMVSRLG